MEREESENYSFQIRNADASASARGTEFDLKRRLSGRLTAATQIADALELIHDMITRHDSKYIVQLS